MPKISLLPQQPSPTTSDKVPVVSGGITDYELISDLITLFFNNIPAGAHSDVTRGNENFLAYVASGGVWTGDSLGVNRNASMTAMICYINGRRISIGAVAARTFTASKDTYIDILDNADGTGTIVYTEVTNNAASPALAANSIRIGIIITGATTIAAATSINQGQESMILPIASSIAYSVTDSLGNLICCRDPAHTLLGMRQLVGNFAPGTTAETLITGLNCPVIIPTGRKVKLALYSGVVTDGTAGQVMTLKIYEGVFGSGGTAKNQANANSTNTAVVAIHPYTPTTASLTFTGTVSSTAGNPTVGASSTAPTYLMVILE